MFLLKKKKRIISLLQNESLDENFLKKHIHFIKRISDELDKITQKLNTTYHGKYQK